MVFPANKDMSEQTKWGYNNHKIDLKQSPLEAAKEYTAKTKETIVEPQKP